MNPLAADQTDVVSVGRDCQVVTGSQAGKINDEVSPGPVCLIGVRGLSNRIPRLFRAGRGRRVERRVSKIDRHRAKQV